METKDLKSLKLSKYQKAIIEYFKANPQSNIMVNALAGTGKSTLICLLTELSNTSDIYVAFNSSIAEEFRNKIKNPKTKVSTLHSLGLAIMNANLAENSKDSKNKSGIGNRNNNSDNKAILDNLKIHKIIDGLIYEEMGRYVKFQYKLFLKDNYVNLYNLCRLTRTELDDENEIRWLIRNHNLFMNYDGDNAEEAVPQIYKVCNWLQYIQRYDMLEFEQNHTIDFTDMLYITYEKLRTGEWKVPYWSLYTNVYIDECLTGDTCINTKAGNKTLEWIYDKYTKKKKLPRVKSFNHKLKKFEHKEITKVIRHEEKREIYKMTVKVSDKETLEVKATDNHKFYTQRGYVYLGDLKVGEDTLFLENFKMGEILNIELIEPDYVYDIEVKDNHNFICKGRNTGVGCLCHNCQDLSTLQIDLLRYVRRNNGRYVAVGDARQAVYFFAAADAHSYDSIKKKYAPMKEFDLPISYRCPIKHVELVNKVFNIPIQARPNAPQGEVINIDKYEIKNYVKPGDLVISRKNKWLPDVILSLAKNGIPIYMEDKEMVEGIKRNIKDKSITSLASLKNKLTGDLNKFNKNLEAIVSRDITVATDDTKNLNDYISTNSKIDNTNFLIAILDCYMETNKKATVSDFYDYINKLLNTTSRKDCVRICSVHKAKGLEANQVFVLNEAEVCLTPYNSKEQNIQEYNLSYISVTRSLDKLYLVAEPEDGEMDEDEEDCDEDDYEDDYEDED